MELHKLAINDKEIFDDYFGRAPHALSAYNFAYIYIWSSIFSVEWAVIKDCLCVFFKDNFGSFLIVPPVGNVTRDVIKSVFDALDNINTNKDIVRIENVDAGGAEFYKSLGYEITEKFPEYVCNREELAFLKGDSFKSKRASVNFFTKNYNYQYQKYCPSDKEECLGLYDSWSLTRSAKSDDPVYVGMLEDSKKAFVILLDDFAKLGTVARIVKVSGAIKGFTCGYELNSDTFVILYEVTDLSIKGLAQFIFMKFCQDLSKYNYINIMDDSGLDNLVKTKLSYHPFKLEPSYIVKGLKNA